MQIQDDLQVLLNTTPNSNNTPTATRSNLSTSNSLPQFTTHQQSPHQPNNNHHNHHNQHHHSQTSQKNMPKSSPPNSPKPNHHAHNGEEIAYNLQLDYWTSTTNGGTTTTTTAATTELLSSSLPNQLGMPQHSQSSSQQKITQKALFKSLHVYRSSHLLAAASTNGAALSLDFPQYLTLVYQMKEKKQKSIL